MFLSLISVEIQGRRKGGGSGDTCQIHRDPPSTACAPCWQSDKGPCWAVHLGGEWAKAEAMRRAYVGCRWGAPLQAGPSQGARQKVGHHSTPVSHQNPLVLEKRHPERSQPAAGTSGSNC